MLEEYDTAAMLGIWGHNFGKLWRPYSITQALPTSMATHNAMMAACKLITPSPETSMFWKSFLTFLGATHPQTAYDWDSLSQRPKFTLPIHDTKNLR